MKTSLLPFLILAIIGLCLSVITHVTALLGLPQPLGSAAWALHVGIFVVWFPAVLVSRKLVSDFKSKDFWKAALRGCPDWMRWITYGFFYYALFNFFFCLATGMPHTGPHEDTPPKEFRLFSGHWMAFYSAAVAILYSAMTTSESDPARRCLNGHPVSPSAKFCETCGAPVSDSKSTSL